MSSTSSLKTEKICHICGKEMVTVGDSSQLICPLHGTRGKATEKPKLRGWLSAYDL